MPPMENSISEAPEQQEDHQQQEEEEGFDSLEREGKPPGMEESCSSILSRNEKRKARKKMKRRQIRKEIAIKEREEEEARLNDPEEQRKMELLEKEEEERRERVRKEFEEREKAWIEAVEMRKKKEQEEEEERRKALEDLEKKQKVENENGEEEDDGDWEYIEEGPAEIIWKGNEIIVKKKKVRVPKKDSDQQRLKQDGDRPTSNPLPPQSEAFAEYKNASAASAQELLENVAQQVPNFGTEQDKAHCPFHLKTGACRFGQRCSRVHFYPDKSCTILIKNMYNGPGLAWEQDEGLEYSDEEVERCYEEFYEDVHTEFLKFGELVNFKVCRNGSFHLRGNVYVHYKSLESAVLAYHSINGRYFAGKQVQCEFVNVTRWKVAICGEYMKSRYRTCSHGTACNFIHCFRNPGGDYEWADWDKQPPRFWVNKMAVLFGYSEEYEYEKQMLPENLGHYRNLSRTMDLDSKRWHSRRSSSRETPGRCDNENDFHNTYDNSERRVFRDESRHEKRNNKYHHHVHSRTNDDLERHRLSRERGREKDDSHTRERWKHRNVPEARKDMGDIKKRSDESDPYEVFSDEDKETRHSHSKRSSRHRRIEHVHNMDVKKRSDESDPYEDCSVDDQETCHSHSKRSSKHRRKEHAHNVDTKKRSDESDPHEDCSDDDKETRHSRSNRSLRHRRIKHAHNMDVKKRSNESDPYDDLSADDKETHHSHSKRSLKFGRIEHAHNMDIKKRSDESDPYEDLSDDDKETHHSSSKISLKQKRIEHAHNMDIKKRSDESDPYEDLSDDDRETRHGYSRRSSKLRKAEHAHNMDIVERRDELDSCEDFSDVRETHNGRSRRSLKCRKVEHIYNMDMENDSFSRNGRIISQRSRGSNSSYLNQNIDIDDRWKPEDKDSKSCWDVQT